MKGCMICFPGVYINWDNDLVSWRTVPCKHPGPCFTPHISYHSCQVKVLCHHDMPLFYTPIYKGYSVPVCSGMRSLVNAYKLCISGGSQVCSNVNYELVSCIGPCNMLGCVYTSQFMNAAEA